MDDQVLFGFFVAWGFIGVVLAVQGLAAFLAWMSEEEDDLG